MRPAYPRCSPEDTLTRRSRDVLLIGMLCLASLSCTDRNPAQSTRHTSIRTLSAGEIADLEAALEVSPEVRELVAIRDELTNRARIRGVTPEMVRTAYREGNVTRAASLLGMGAVDTDEMARRLTRARTALYRKHPVIEEMVAGSVVTGAACPAEEAARAVAIDASPGRAGSRFVEVDNDELGCKWLQYTVALALCSTAGPVIYWPCAYLAYCSLCTDDLGICI